MNLRELLGVGNGAHRASNEVWRYEHENEWLVDTCAVIDADHPWETGVRHVKFNGAECIIVEEYDSPEAARTGHDKWVAFMQKGTPAVLVDVSTSKVSKLMDANGGPGWRAIPCQP